MSNQKYPQQPQYPQQMQGQQFVQQPAGTVPVIHPVDEAAMRAKMEQDKMDAQNRRNSGGPFPVFARVPGPDGSTKWGSVTVGFSNSIMVHICPPSGPGKVVRVEQSSHFYRSYDKPNGTGLLCPGISHCLVCQSVEPGLNNPDPEVQKRAKDIGKVRKKYLYNVINTSIGIQGHVGQDGVPRPQILDAGVTVRDEINEIFEDCGFQVTYPDTSRLIKLKKSKTGNNVFDIDWSARQQDVAPLSPEFYPIFNNLWDLEAQLRMPSQDDMAKAVRAMGLTAPGGGAAFSPHAQPPHANPYQAPAPLPIQAYEQTASQPVYQPAPMAPPVMNPPPMQAPPAPQQGYYAPPPMQAAPLPPTGPVMSDDAELRALQQQLAGK